MPLDHIHVCFKRVGVGTNGILECQILTKNDPPLPTEANPNTAESMVQNERRAVRPIHPSLVHPS
jgi:hypothetical protein